MSRRKFNKEKIVKTTSDIAGKAVDAMEVAADKTEDAIDMTKEKVEEFMNKPEILEAKENFEDIADKAVEPAKTVVKSIRTKVSEVVIQYGEDFLLADIEKAVKKDAANKKLKGDIKIYLNVSEKTAYYTVNGEGDSTMKVHFS